MQEGCRVVSSWPSLQKHLAPLAPYPIHRYPLQHMNRDGTLVYVNSPPRDAVTLSASYVLSGCKSLAEDAC